MAKKRTATFLGPQLGLSIAGNHAYAFSGEQTLPNTTEVTMLDFVSPEQNLKAKFGFAMNLTNQGATDIQMQILFNGQVVFNLYVAAAIDRYGNAGPFPDPTMIIPSQTNVQVIMRNDENVVVTGTCWIMAEIL